MQRRLDLETAVNKHFENVFMSGAYSKFFSGRGHQFSSLFMRNFSTDLILSNLSNTNDSRGSGGILPRKFFKNLHTAMVILVLFEQFLRKVCHIFGP